MIIYLSARQGSLSQTHYPRAFVDINTVDHGKTRNKAAGFDQKHVGVLSLHNHGNSPLLHKFSKCLRNETETTTGLLHRFNL